MVDNKKINQVNKQLRKQMLDKFGVIALAALVVGAVGFFGLIQNKASHAATIGALSATPVPTGAVVGANVVVTVNEDSGTDTVNAVQAGLTYDATKLQYVSIAEGTAFPNIAATSTATSGVIRIARGTLANKSVTGQQKVASITFKVLGSSGSTSVAYDKAYSYIVRSTDNANILTTVTNASIAMKLPAPTLSAVSPSSIVNPVSTTTPSYITITGSNFVSGAKVSVGGVASSATTFTSSSSLRAVIPPHANGIVDVVVTNPDGQTAAKSAVFTYAPQAPAITSISPTSGSTAGGTKVTIAGSGFTGNTSLTVSFGDIAGTSLTVISDVQLTVFTPAHVAGAVAVKLSNGLTTTTAAGNFNYVASAPSVSGFSPTSGPLAGTTIVTITGANFVSGAKVTFGSTSATNVTFVNSGSLKATVPAQTTSATAAVVVTNPDGQKATAATVYSYFIAGDANGDGRVNAIDLSMLISHDGQNYPASDFNKDGAVGAADLAILLAKWTW